jgi:hypothetical protein
VPLWALATALGAAWLARPLADLELWGPLRGRHLLAAALAALCVVQTADARRDVGRLQPPEIEAARAEAPFLRARLAPDESVMVLTTSLWSWYLDRPSVHLVIADEARFLATVRRLKVRWAALPTSRIPTLAARFPGGRLPRALRLHHADPARDVTVFRVVDPGPP